MSIEESQKFKKCEVCNRQIDFVYDFYSNGKCWDCKDKTINKIKKQKIVKKKKIKKKKVKPKKKK